MNHEPTMPHRHEVIEESYTRVIVVGDIHGCFDELLRLIEKLEITDNDRLLFAGDLVAKGPHSDSVVRFARDHQIKSVLGNHDMRWLRYWYTQDASVLNDQARREADKLSDEDWHYLSTLPLSIRLPAHNLLIVHAGIVPGVALEDQSEQNILNMRSMMPDGNVAYRAAQGAPWASLWAGPEYIVFGHDAVRGIQEYPFATGLDSGCVYGRELTAIILPEKKFVSVPAKKVYRAP